MESSFESMMFTDPWMHGKMKEGEQESASQKNNESERKIDGARTRTRTRGTQPKTKPNHPKK